MPKTHAVTTPLLRNQCKWGFGCQLHALRKMSKQGRGKLAENHGAGKWSMSMRCKIHAILVWRCPHAEWGHNPCRCHSVAAASFSSHVVLNSSMQQCSWSAISLLLHLVLPSWQFFLWSSMDGVGAAGHAGQAQPTTDRCMSGKHRRCTTAPARALASRSLRASALRPSLSLAVGLPACAKKQQKVESSRVRSPSASNQCRHPAATSPSPGASLPWHGRCRAGCL